MLRKLTQKPLFFIHIFCELWSCLKEAFWLFTLKFVVFFLFNNHRKMTPHPHFRWSNAHIARKLSVTSDVIQPPADYLVVVPGGHWVKVIKTENLPLLPVVLVCASALQPTCFKRENCSIGKQSWFLIYVSVFKVSLQLREKLNSVCRQVHRFHLNYNHSYMLATKAIIRRFLPIAWGNTHSSLATGGCQMVADWSLGLRD